MLEVLSKSEAVAVLCLLMAGADDEIRMEEISSMLNNPFFKEHVTNKIGNHKRFLKSFNTARSEQGKEALEMRAVKIIKSAFPAFQLKVLALLTLIAGADENYDQSEKEMMARLATELGISMASIQPELDKMKEAILNESLHNDEDEAVDNTKNEANDE